VVFTPDHIDDDDPTNDKAGCIYSDSESENIDGYLTSHTYTSSALSGEVTVTAYGLFQDMNKDTARLSVYPERGKDVLIPTPTIVENYPDVFTENVINSKFVYGEATLSGPDSANYLLPALPLNNGETSCGVLKARVDPLPLTGEYEAFDRAYDYVIDSVHVEFTPDNVVTSSGQDPDTVYVRVWAHFEDPLDKDDSIVPENRKSAPNHTSPYTWTVYIDSVKISGADAGNYAPPGYSHSFFTSKDTNDPAAKILADTLKGAWMAKDKPYDGTADAEIINYLHANEQRRHRGNH
jgi:hypothetical protein